MLRVLIIDDSLIIRKQIREISRELGYRVAGTARDGEEGVLMYHLLKPDITIMDISMPTVNGINATRRIMLEDKKAKILILTSNGQEDMVLNAMKAGASGYLLKPLTKHAFKTAVVKILNESEKDIKDDGNYDDDVLSSDAANLL